LKSKAAVLGDADNGGRIRLKRFYIETIPIPTATIEQKAAIVTLVNCILIRHITNSQIESPLLRSSLDISYFEQWINGLVYELYFSDELHPRGFRLFDETFKLMKALQTSDLDTLDNDEKLKLILKLYENAYDIKGPIRAILFSIQSLETIRIIEGEK
jgi:hypothetical protein